MSLLEIKELPRYESIRKIAERIPEVNATALVVTLAIVSVADTIDDYMGGYLKKYNLTQGRFRVLMILFEDMDRELTSCEIAHRCGVTRATMTGLLDGLEKSGHVRREAHPTDRRMTIVRLTDFGKQFLFDILPTHFGNVNRIMSGMNERELKSLGKLLEKVRESAAGSIGPDTSMRCRGDE